MDNKERDKVLLTVGAGFAAYFLVVKPLLSAVGIDPASQANIESINMLDPSKNPFDMNFANGAVASGAAVPDGKTFFTNLKFIGDSQSTVYNSAGSDLNNVYALGEAINNSFSWYNTDLTAITTIFNEVRSKAEVSDIAAYLFYNYNINLWALLNTGASWIPFSQAGVPANQLSQIVNHISSLPNE